MVKTDDKVEFENAEGKKDYESYTNFELLEAKVNHIKGMVEEITLILRNNNISRSEKVEAPYFDEDKMLDDLEAEKEVESK